MDFSSCHKQRSRPPCDVSDADNLIALYNASWRHIILTYIFLLSSAPDLLSSMLSPAPSPPVRLQRQWEVACSCGPGAPAHIWSSGKKKTLCSHVVIHAAVMSKHLWPCRKPQETFSLVLYWLYSQHEVKFILNYYFYFFHKNKALLKASFLSRTQKKKKFQSKWIYGAISSLIITVSSRLQVGFTHSNISHLFFLPANE